MENQLRKTAKMYINLQSVEIPTTAQQKIGKFSLWDRCQIFLPILSEY